MKKLTRVLSIVILVGLLVPSFALAGTPGKVQLALVSSDPAITFMSADSTARIRISGGGEVCINGGEYYESGFRVSVAGCRLSEDQKRAVYELVANCPTYEKYDDYAERRCPSYAELAVAVEKYLSQTWLTVADTNWSFTVMLELHGSTWYARLGGILIPHKLLPYAWEQYRLTIPENT